MSAHTSPTVRLRLTRRGRLVMTTLAALFVGALVAAAATFGATSAGATGEAEGGTAEGASVEFGYVVVQPGDSLWSLAAALDPSSDPRDLIAEMVRLNQLAGSGVQAGDALAVPLRLSDAAGVVSAEQLGL